MYILFSIGFCELVSYLYQSLIRLGEKDFGQRGARILAGGAIAGGIVFLLGTTQLFAQGMKIHQVEAGLVEDVRHNNWERAMNCISAHADTSDVIITPWPLLSRYYGSPWKMFLLNRLVAGGGEKPFVSGATVINDLETLKKALQEESSGWLVSEKTRFYSGRGTYLARSMPIEVREWVSETFSTIDCPLADDMVIWRWHSKEN